VGGASRGSLRGWFRASRGVAARRVPRCARGRCAAAGCAWWVCRTWPGGRRLREVAAGQEAGGPAADP